MLSVPSRIWAACAVALLLGCSSAVIRAEDKPTEKSTVLKLDVEQFDRKRHDSDAVVLDVRTANEFQEGHVPGAVNLDIHDPQFAEKLKALDKSKTYLVHCAKGYRSGLASAQMSKIGFEHLFDFNGGFVSWQAAHKPVEKGAGPTTKPAH